MISIEEFKKVELRVGKIVKVEDHPNADKLYILEVDLGDEKRKLVAGIKEYYKKEELVGKYVIVVSNLEPKRIRGVESQGMILAADDGEKIALLTVDREVKVGARVL